MHRYDIGFIRAFPTMRIPPVTKALLWALGLTFVLQQLLGELATRQLLLWPLGEHFLGVDGAGEAVTASFRPWQLLTYAFLHANLMHLFFNALALFQFGPAIEQAWGGRRYAIYLAVCVVGAGVLQLVVSALGPAGEAHPVLGASGGMYAILLAYGMLFPKHRMMLIFPPIPMSARTFVIVFGVASLVMGVTGTQQGVAHFVHLGGMLFGWLLIRFWLDPAPRQPATFV
jgi:membrane associated rhomboid family serine protease